MARQWYQATSVSLCTKQKAVESSEGASVAKRPKLVSLYRSSKPKTHRQSAEERKPSQKTCRRRQSRHYRQTRQPSSGQASATAWRWYSDPAASSAGLFACGYGRLMCRVRVGWTTCVTGTTTGCTPRGRCNVTPMCRARDRRNI